MGKIINSPWIMTVIGLMIGLLAGYVFVFGPEVNQTDNSNIINDVETDLTENTEKEDEASFLNLHIKVSDQPISETAIIDEVLIPEQGAWIAIHNERDNQPGWVLGAIFQRPGRWQNIEVPLIQALEPGSRHYAVLHQDGSGLDLDQSGRTFDSSRDLPIIGSTGNWIMDQFQVEITGSGGQGI
ncbi:MAG: DUF7282 domain-containing protein [Patescibacteria group bacterium]